MIDTTICIVSHDACDALALAVESFKRHHSDLPVYWHILDTGSKDGAKEYAEGIADLLLYGERIASHGESLTRLVRTVETPYFLALDNDIETTAPFMPMLYAALEPEDMYCACLTRLYPWGSFDIGGTIMQPLWSPNIAVGLHKTAKVQRLLEWTSFGYWMNAERKEHSETGAMVYRFAMASGYRLVELSELWDAVIHHGSISALFNQTVPDPVLVQRYEVVKKHLSELREGQWQSGQRIAADIT